MPQTYRFQVSMPVTDLLPRNRVVNALHFEHSIGGIVDTDLKSFCDSIIDLYQRRYGNASQEVECKAYDTDAVPNYPRATSIVNAGVVWGASVPRELAFVMSFAGANKGNKNERGRVYLAPYLYSGIGQFGVRPTASQLQWALEWYSKANESFPDLGGVDWKFGVWSRVLKKFTQAKQAWVNDDWDIQRRRGLRESTRVAVTREG